MHYFSLSVYMLNHFTTWQSTRSTKLESVSYTQLYKLYYTSYAWLQHLSKNCFEERFSVLHNNWLSWQSTVLVMISKKQNNKYTQNAEKKLQKLVLAKIY